MADYSKEIKALLNSAIGKEIERTIIEDLQMSIIEDAQKADTQETAFGLLKESRGVIRVIEHLRSIASLAPKDEGSQ